MKRVIVIALSLMMVCTLMIPAALADSSIYKSSYVVAGYPGGVGAYIGTGPSFGVYGGVILGNLGDSSVESCVVTGSYDSSSECFIVRYDITLDSVPSTWHDDLPYVYLPVSLPRGVTLSFRSLFSGSGNWIEAWADQFHYFTEPVTCASLSDGSTYVADIDKTVYAYGLHPVFWQGRQCVVELRISDPEAVTSMSGHEHFLDTILYPFTKIAENSFVVNFVASIWTTPLVKPFFTLAISSLALCLIVKFMR